MDIFQIKILRYGYTVTDSADNGPQWCAIKMKCLQRNANWKRVDDDRAPDREIRSTLIRRSQRLAKVDGPSSQIK